MEISFNAQKKYSGMLKKVSEMKAAICSQVQLEDILKVQQIVFRLLISSESSFLNCERAVIRSFFGDMTPVRMFDSLKNKFASKGVKNIVSELRWV